MTALVSRAARAALGQRPLLPELVLLHDDGALSLAPEVAGQPPRPGYLPPEARGAKSIPRDPAALVWTAGALAHELITGLPPDPGPRLGLDVHKPLREVIERALAADRAQRFRDLEELAEAFAEVPPFAGPDRARELLRAAAVAASRGPTPSAPPPPRLTPPPLPLPEETGRFARPAGLRVSPTPAPPRQPDAVLGKIQLEEDLSRAQPGAAQFQAELAAQKKAADEALARLARVEEIVRALEPEPDRARIVARRAQTLCGLRRFEEAEKELEAALEVSPLSAALHLEMGRVHSAQGDSNRGHAFVAETEFARAVQLAPGWALAHAMLGQCRLRLGRRREAVEGFRTALSLDALCLEAQLGMARAQRRWPIALAGAAGGAAASLALVLALPLAQKPPPTSPTAAIMAKRPPMVVPLSLPSPYAVEPARQPAPEREAKVEAPPPPAAAEPPAPTSAPAVVKAPTPAPAPPPAPAPKKRVASGVSPERRSAALAHIQNGEKALRIGKMEEAIDEFETALASDPSHAAAHRGLGMALVMMGKEEEAKKEYRAYLKLDPKAPDAERIRRLLSEK